MRISGLVKFGGASSLGGATLAGFDLPTAQVLFQKQGKLDQIRAKAKAGDLAGAARRRDLGDPPAGNAGAHRRGPGEGGREGHRGLPQLPPDFLLAFGIIALFVGAFVIANSLSITIAQRTRELATLRTLGASRKQVLGSILVEALVDGLPRLGRRDPARARARHRALQALRRRRLHAAEQRARPADADGRRRAARRNRSSRCSQASGPAFRATRVPPISAVREGATLPPGRFARWRTPWAITLTAPRLRRARLRPLRRAAGTAAVLAFMGVGTLLIFFGVALLSARIARPLAWALGWPAARIGGAAGTLARDNSRRNPQRTGFDRVRPDDRPRARHARLGPRGRDHDDVPRRRRRPLDQRLRGHRAEQLLARSRSRPAKQRRRRPASRRSPTCARATPRCSAR